MPPCACSLRHNGRADVASDEPVTAVDTLMMLCSWARQNTPPSDGTCIHSVRRVPMSPHTLIYTGLWVSTCMRPLASRGLTRYTIHAVCRVDCRMAGTARSLWGGQQCAQVRT